MKSTAVGFSFLLVGILASGTAVQARATFSGRVNRVWQDGFQLNTVNRAIIVDSYDICGDRTTRHLRVGTRVTVTGEFEGGEFDAFSIRKAGGERVCR